MEWKSIAECTVECQQAETPNDSFGWLNFLCFSYSACLYVDSHVCVGGNGDDIPKKNSLILFAFHTFVSPLSLVFGRLHRKICRNGILLWMWVNFFSQHIKWSWTFIISGWLSMLCRNHFIYINVCPAYSPIIHSKQNSPEHIVWSIFNFILAHTHGKFWTLFHTFRSHELSIATDTLSYQSQF